MWGIAGAAFMIGLFTTVNVSAQTVHQSELPPSADKYSRPLLSAKGSCNGDGENIFVSLDSVPYNVVICRLSRNGPPERKFIELNVPAGEGDQKLACSKEGSTDYRYEIHWYDFDTTYFPRPITDGVNALTLRRGGLVLQNNHTYKRIEVQYIKSNGQHASMTIFPESSEQFLPSWKLVNASYVSPYKADDCSNEQY